MKQNLFLFVIVYFVLSNFCHGQYSISGYLDTSAKNKRVYLSLLRYNEQYKIAKEQVLMSTLTDSLGYFSFEGKLLSDNHAFYRIHSRVDESKSLIQFIYREEFRNFHNFVFSNTDTIVFRKNNKFWFSSNTNTNPIDRQWQEFNNYSVQLSRELLSVTDFKQKNQSSTQMLSELKAYANGNDIHPLVTLVLLSNVEEGVLKDDFKINPEFYELLQDSLNGYYNNTGYAKQFNELITDFSKTETQLELKFYRLMAYTLGAISFILCLGVVFLFVKLKQKKNEDMPQENINLTNQEERISELMIQDKTNKEIATELFISLSTVKTHIRNIYAKLEVSNRQELLDKLKKHSWD